MNNNEQTQDPTKINLVVVGDVGVGKTCILISHTIDTFPTEYDPTVFDNYTAQVKINGESVNLELVDTSGQETYDHHRVLSYGMADIFLIVCDVTESSSFDNVIQKWIPELSKGNLVNVPKIVVGTKIDMRDRSNPKHINAEDALQILAQQNCEYFECSALTQQGLKQVFDGAIKIFLNRKQFQSCFSIY